LSNRCRGGLVNQAASAFRAQPPGQELSAPDIDNALYYHTLGASGSADRQLSANSPQPDWQYEPHLSRDGRWLVVEVGRGEVGDTGCEDVYLFDLEASAPSAVPITRGFDASYLYVGTDQGKIYFLTTLDAPRGRVVAIDPANPARDLWQTVIPEGEDAIALTEPRVTLVDHQLIVRTLHDAQS
jgi:prolyl oligopeptidase